MLVVPYIKACQGKMIVLDWPTIMTSSGNKFKTHLSLSKAQKSEPLLSVSDIECCVGTIIYLDILFGLGILFVFFLIYFQNQNMP
jgi:hypothetical protein